VKSLSVQGDWRSKKHIVVSETEMNVDLMAHHICKLTFSNLLTKHAKF